MNSKSTTHPHFPHLLSPIRIGPKQLRCRVLVTAHEIRLGDGSIPGARYAAYHRARARGGAGLQITGCTAIHHTGGLGSVGALANVDDSIIDGYRILSSAVHEEGGVILAQLGHSAATGHATEPGAPVWAPSAVVGELMRHGQRAHAMSVDEIAEIAGAFGAAADALPQGRDGRRRDPGRIRVPGRGVSVPGGQSANRRLRGQPREPYAVLPGGGLGGARSGGA